MRFEEIVHIVCQTQNGPHCTVKMKTKKNRDEKKNFFFIVHKSTINKYADKQHTMRWNILKIANENERE